MLERFLAPLFTCPDCHGKGEREHAVWPKVQLRVTENVEASTDVEYESPRKEYKACETCRGTGRA